ncbi:hypothetical protein F2P81_004256 [Scophthalmus maximus]|uniref:Uncharacterized protein n=1 Tax=Scophthalmus maximus TaxID=52904 RepID=A0A6A4TDD9_SCOMX|nr:hypothetical protein F2P81_004256 [Scophthalmus maximus]
MTPVKIFSVSVPNEEVEASELSCDTYKRQIRRATACYSEALSGHSVTLFLLVLRSPGSDAVRPFMLTSRRRRSKTSQTERHPIGSDGFEVGTLFPSHRKCHGSAEICFLYCHIVNVGYKRRLCAVVDYKRSSMFAL